MSIEMLLAVFDLYTSRNKQASKQTKQSKTKQKTYHLQNLNGIMNMHLDFLKLLPTKLPFPFSGHFPFVFTGQSGNPECHVGEPVWPSGRALCR